MWTVKRILIYTVGLFASLSGFAVYTVFLGVIDGVQPLPPEFLPPLVDTDPNDEPPPPPDYDRRLKESFGPVCMELQRPLRLWLPDKGIVFATGEFGIDKDGRVRLAPFSAALYHKNQIPSKFPEISTVRCDVALLTLDRPVSTMGELNNRKIIGIELQGQTAPHFITITNNRRTAEKNDDVDIRITNGPLYYRESRNQIWTEGVVCVTDYQTKPPTVINGRGMDMYLAKDTGPNAPRRAKKPNETETSSVEKIVLRADVDMKFWVEQSSGFLGGTATPPKATPGTKLEKELIHIRTGGPFHYDLIKETAWFESPPAQDARGAKDPFAPDQVHVHRMQKANGGQKFDQLSCDRLDLKFRKKIGPAGNELGGNKEIETANATCRENSEVTLALDSEGMAAFGNEMFYRAGDEANGPLTILKGEPKRLLRTAKDGHKMKCQELHLFGANKLGDGQRAWAKGPGVIDLLDAKDPNKNSFPTHLIWRDTLTVVKEKEGDKFFDHMTMIGEASYMDDLQNQALHGEKIEAWVEQMQETAKKLDATSAARQELRRVIAVDRVRAFSAEFIVRKADRLTMIMLPTLARNSQLPDLPAAPKAGAGPMPIPDKGPNPEPMAEKKVPVEEKKKPSPPIELDANEITVTMATVVGKKQNEQQRDKELQDLIAKGNVHVFQAGERPGEKALDITGNLLTVKHVGIGHTMTVYGDKNKLAQLELGDTIIWGPLVTINQSENRADVDGQGAMEMPSNKTIDGAAQAKQGSRITIDWKKSMTFDGRLATFYGGVQARENGTYNRALCEQLQAMLDKHVSFMEGQKDKQSAKIDRLVFDKNVFIEEYRFDEKKQPLQYNKMQGVELINHADGPTFVKGSGFVKSLAKGAVDTNFGPPAGGAPKDKSPKTGWKLTHVKFRDSMSSNQKPDLKKATFYGLNSGVEVFHFPTLKVDDTMDPDHPPLDGLYLRCDQLEVEGKQDKERTTQTMIAKRNVYFRTDKYLGYSDVLKYDEATDRVIFEGLNGNPVLLYEILENGRTQPKSIRSSKVLYNRKTGQIDTDGVKSITN